MTTTASSAFVVYDPGPVDPEHLALAGFLGGYRGLTRDADALDLRQFVAFCDRGGLELFEVTAATSRPSAANSRPRGGDRDDRPAAVYRDRLTPLRFGRSTDRSLPVGGCPPAAVYAFHAIGLDRNEVGALLVAAGLGPASEHALISLLALNGLRVSEAIGADIEALGVERRHRTRTVLRKGRKIVTIPLTPRTARAVDLTSIQTVGTGYRVTLDTAGDQAVIETDLVHGAGWVPRLSRLRLDTAGVAYSTGGGVTVAGRL